MVSITDKLEGLLPADGPQTDDERVIADAVRELRRYARDLADADMALEMAIGDVLDAKGATAGNGWPLAALGFAAGCIASAIFVGWV